MTTANTDLTQQQYNKFTDLPNFSYNIIKYLIANNDTIWRLLKYIDPNAYRIDADHPNLTAAQKGALVYDGIKEQTEYRVFQEVGQDASWDIQACVLRVSTLEIIPTNYIYGYVTIVLECFCHSQISQLSNYQTRVDLIMQQLLETLNGVDMESLGRLYFDARASSKCRMYPIGAIPWRGKAIIMANHLA